ncbi:MAG: molecular chaperone DnaJ [Chromatiaceae bacterium]|nr:MAG: molecular chaperone DnaJ [Chromatiaceae bacterium]
MIRLLFPLVLLGGLLWFLHWFRTTPAPRVARALRQGVLWGAVGLVLLLTLSGRLNPIFAAVAALIPALWRLLHLLAVLPSLQRLLQSLGLGGAGGSGAAWGSRAGAGSGSGRAAGSTSSIRTRYLEMTLVHASGVMDGLVLTGPFAGSRLSTLALNQLLRMLELYQDSDEQSAAVLAAYLDREHADWRERAADQSDHHAEPRAAIDMTRDDALAILGLAADADAEQVRAAHRRLMQKLHPDRGGSDYLAAQINRAKHLLLGE